MWILVVGSTSVDDYLEGDILGLLLKILDQALKLLSCCSKRINILLLYYRLAGIKLYVD